MSSKRDIVDDLRRMLKRAGVTDADLDGGASLTSDGQSRAARALGIDLSEMPLLLRALVQRIRDERVRFDTMTEDLGGNVQRYSFEKDALGNVTLRDSLSGESRFLSGTAAAALLTHLSGTSAEQQAAIAAVWGQGQSVSEATIVPSRSRAMTANQEDHAVEREHHVAHAQTGFYGRQGAGCLVLAQDTGRVLLMHRSGDVLEPGTWGNCGGAVDAGTSPRDHALQELYEETGYHGSVSAMIPLFVFQSGSFRYSNFLAIVPQEFEPSLNWESDASRWCVIGKWPRPLHFGLEALFADAESVDKIERVAASANDGVRESVECADAYLIEDDEVEPAILDEEDDFDAEIRRGTGTFNFTWKVDGRQGFGTAAFKPASHGSPLSVKLISVQNQDGDPFEPDPKLAEAIQERAVAFIGQE